MGTFVFIVFSLFLQNYVFAVTWPTPRQTFTVCKYILNTYSSLFFKVGGPKTCR